MSYSFYVMFRCQQRTHKTNKHANIVGFLCFPLISFGVHRCSSVFFVVHPCSSMFTDVHRCSSMLVEFLRFSSLFIGVDQSAVMLICFQFVSSMLIDVLQYVIWCSCVLHVLIVVCLLRVFKLLPNRMQLKMKHKRTQNEPNTNYTINSLIVLWLTLISFDVHRSSSISFGYIYIYI